MMDREWIILGAITGLTLIEIVALFLGINGGLMAAMMAIIAGLAGYVVPSPIQK